MALLAETLVEEWLNRQEFLTIRGIKLGVHEIDLLAIEHQDQRRAWHIEVQASFRSVSYLAGLPAKLAKSGALAELPAKTAARKMCAHRLPIGSSGNFSSKASKLCERDSPAEQGGSLTSSTA